MNFCTAVSTLSLHIELKVFWKSTFRVALLDGCQMVEVDPASMDSCLRTPRNPKPKLVGNSN